MNRKDFRDEIASKYSQEIIDKYDRFCKYQDVTWGTLLWFVNICDKYNIYYQLAYGSLLGAIRDGGQIPWDYDIDVFVPYKYRKKLVEALKKEKNENYYFVSSESQKYYDTILRVVPKGYDEAFIHVDVFFLIGTSNNETERIRQRKEINELFFKRYYKLFNPQKASYGQFKPFVRLFIKKIVGQFVNLKYIDMKLEQLAFQYTIEDSDYLTTLDQWATVVCLPSSIYEVIDVEVQSNSFKIPKMYDAILKEMYGDYMKIPSLDNRVSEFVRHCEYVDKFGI